MHLTDVVKLEDNMKLLTLEEGSNRYRGLYARNSRKNRKEITSYKKPHNGFTEGINHIFASMNKFNTRYIKTLLYITKEGKEE